MKTVLIVVAASIFILPTMPTALGKDGLNPQHLQAQSTIGWEQHCPNAVASIKKFSFSIGGSACNRTTMKWPLTADDSSSSRSSPVKVDLAKFEAGNSTDHRLVGRGKSERQIGDDPRTAAKTDSPVHVDTLVPETMVPDRSNSFIADRRELKVAQTGEPAFDPETKMKLLKAFEAMGIGDTHEGPKESEEDANDHLSELSDAQVCSQIAQQTGRNQEAAVRFWQEPSMLLAEGKQRGLTSEICSDLVKLDDTQGGMRSSTSVADEAVELLSSRITKETKTYRFKVQGLEPVESNEIVEGLAGGYLDTRIQFDTPERPSQIGYLFFAGSDHVLCELKRNVATWCVEGLGLRTDTECETGWENQIDKSQSFRSDPIRGTVFYCEVNTLHGTGMSAKGVALFHYDVDEALTYIGYVPTNEYMSGLMVDPGLVAGFETEISLLSNDKTALRFSVCPSIEVSTQEDDGKPVRRRKLTCAEYSIAGTTPTLKFQGPDEAKPLSNELLMIVFEAEASALGRN